MTPCWYFFNTVLSPISGAVRFQFPVHGSPQWSPFTSIRASAVPTSTCNHLLHHTPASKMHFWVRGHYDCYYYHYVRDCRISKTTGLLKEKDVLILQPTDSLLECELACRLRRGFASGEDSAKERCCNPPPTHSHRQTHIYTEAHTDSALWVPF